MFGIKTAEVNPKKMNWSLVMVRVFGISMFVATAVVAAIVVKNFDQVEVSAKENVAKSIVGGTLSLGALALVFLGYSLAQRREHFGEDPEQIYSRVAIVMYLLIPLSLFDALTSTVYLLISSSCSYASTTYSWLFELSLALLFVIGGALIVATTYIVAEEFSY